MDTDRIAALVRALSCKPSRRDISRTLVGLGLGSGFAPLISPGMDHASGKGHGHGNNNHKKKNDKKKHKPPPRDPTAVASPVMQAGIAVSTRIAALTGAVVILAQSDAVRPAEPVMISAATHRAIPVLALWPVVRPRE